MQTIDAKDVRTRLKELLDQISGGEEFVITKYGKPVARLGPIRPEQVPVESVAQRQVPGPAAANARQRRIDQLLKGSRSKG